MGKGTKVSRGTEEEQGREMEEGRASMHKHKQKPIHRPHPSPKSTPHAGIAARPTIPATTVYTKTKYAATVRKKVIFVPCAGQRSKQEQQQKPKHSKPATSQRHKQALHRQKQPQSFRRNGYAESAAIFITTGQRDPV